MHVVARKGESTDARRQWIPTVHIGIFNLRNAAQHPRNAGASKHPNMEGALRIDMDLIRDEGPTYMQASEPDQFRPVHSLR
eukprot:93050-Pyramimonas_sp.AAC.1